MNTHEGPLLRDLISTADQPVGNIPAVDLSGSLSDLVGTGIDLTRRVPTDQPPAYRVGEYNEDDLDLDAFFATEEGQALTEWFRLRRLIDWHVDTTLEYLVEHPEVYANHDHPDMLGVLVEWVQ